MESKRIKSILLIIAIALGILLVILNNTEFNNYKYIVGVLLLIDIIVIFIYCNNTKSANSIFKSKIKNITNTYDSILVYIDKLPSLKKKDIIKVNKFEDLINTQGEVKKPIFYSVEEKTAAFVIIDNNLVCYHIIKENDDLLDPIEEKILKEAAKRELDSLDESILEDIEKTTIIKLQNKGAYKVSPIRKKENKEEKVTEIALEENTTENKKIIVEDKFSSENTKEENTTYLPQPDVKESNMVEEYKEKKSIKINHATERARKYREKQKRLKKVG